MVRQGVAAAVIAVLAIEAGEERAWRSSAAWSPATAIA